MSANPNQSGSVSRSHIGTIMRKINRPRLKCNQLWRLSGYTSIPFFSPFIPCVLQKMFRNLSGRATRKQNDQACPGILSIRCWFHKRHPIPRPNNEVSFVNICLSVCLSHLFYYVPVIVSPQNFQELLPMTKVMSLQKVKVIGQRSRSQRS